MKKPIILNEANPVFKLKLTSSLGYILIEKVIFSHLVGKDWLMQIMNEGLYLEVTEWRKDNQKSTWPINLVSEIGSMHRQPVVVFTEKYCVPAGNYNNTSAFVFYDRAEIAVKSWNEKLPEKFALTIFYSETPHVELI